MPQLSIFIESTEKTEKWQKVCQKDLILTDTLT